MRLVVADTSPLCYLLAIGHIELLPQLFGTVFIPEAVQDEIRDSGAPETLQEWATSLPSWVEVVSIAPGDYSPIRGLGPGERAAIALAVSIHADVILIDDRKGR